MEAIRAMILGRPWMAALLVAAALCVRVLVPTGFMPVVAAGAVTIQPCPDAGPTVAAARAMPGMDATMAPGMAMPDHRDHHGTPNPPGKAETPCAFGGLAAPSLAAVDPAVLAIAVAVAMATAFRLPDRAVPRTAAHLRPPGRGPPATF